MPESLNLLHLSDIHFNKWSGQDWDLDSDLRNQLTADAMALRQELGHFDGAVVTGDIAFSGDRRQFDVALEWLEELSDRCGFPLSNVWVTPGNHDVDRTRAGVARVSDARRVLRSRERRVDEVLRDHDYAPVFYEALQEYNHFASNFDCQLEPSRPTWQFGLGLNDGSELVLVGLNSVLVSGPDDHQDTGKMVLGPVAQLMPPDSGRVYMTLAHHPLTWLVDHDTVNDELQARARIQLFGHTHDPVVQQIDNCLRIVAGATHPERSESGWEPRYNAIQMQVMGEWNARTLEIRLHQRVWRRKRLCFGPCHERTETPPEVFSLSLPSWSAPKPAPEPSPDLVAPLTSAQSDSVPNTVAAEEVTPVDPYRALVRKFLALSIHSRHRVLVEVGLLSNDDDPPPPLNQAWAEALGTARGRPDLLTTVWDRVQVEVDGNEPSPFRGEPA